MGPGSEEGTMGLPGPYLRVGLLLLGQGLSARLGAPNSSAWEHGDRRCWAAPAEDTVAWPRSS